LYIKTSVALVEQLVLQCIRQHLNVRTLTMLKSIYEQKQAFWAQNKSVYCYCTCSYDKSIPTFFKKPSMDI